MMDDWLSSLDRDGYHYPPPRLSRADWIFLAACTVAIVALCAWLS